MASIRVSEKKRSALLAAAARQGFSAANQPSKEQVDSLAAEVELSPKTVRSVLRDEWTPKAPAEPEASPAPERPTQREIADLFGNALADALRRRGVISPEGQVVGLVPPSGVDTVLAELDSTGVVAAVNEAGYFRLDRETLAQTLQDWEVLGTEEPTPQPELPQPAENGNSAVVALDLGQKKGPVTIEVPDDREEGSEEAVEPEAEAASANANGGKQATGPLTDVQIKAKGRNPGYCQQFVPALRAWARSKGIELPVPFPKVRACMQELHARFNFHNPRTILVSFVSDGLCESEDDFVLRTAREWAQAQGVEIPIPRQRSKDLVAALGAAGVEVGNPRALRMFLEENELLERPAERPQTDLDIQIGGRFSKPPARKRKERPQREGGPDLSGAPAIQAALRGDQGEAPNSAAAPSGQAEEGTAEPALPPAQPVAPPPSGRSPVRIVRPVPAPKPAAAPSGEAGQEQVVAPQPARPAALPQSPRPAAAPSGEAGQGQVAPPPARPAAQPQPPKPVVLAWDKAARLILSRCQPLPHAGQAHGFAAKLSAELVALGFESATPEEVEAFLRPILPPAPQPEPPPAQPPVAPPRQERREQPAGDTNAAPAKRPPQPAMEGPTEAQIAAVEWAIEYLDLPTDPQSFTSADVNEIMEAIAGNPEHRKAFQGAVEGRRRGIIRHVLKAWDLLAPKPADGEEAPARPKRRNEEKEKETEEPKGIRAYLRDPVVLGSTAIAIVVVVVLAVKFLF